MPVPVLRLVSILLGVLAAASPALAADYWVKNGGNDGLNGLSVATAWATLTHAASEVAPGDTVHVLDGSYQGFYQTTSGAPGAPITWKAEGSAVAITANNPNTPDGINLEGASHVVIDGFVVNGRTRAGIRVVLGEFVTVRNCRTGYNGTWGIFTGHVDDFTAEHNEAHHSQVEHGIYVSNACDRPVVRGNWVHDNHGNGLHFNGDASYGGDGLIEDALVEDNVIHGNGAGGGSGINMDGGTNGLIRNNLLFDNHASGISLYRIDAAAGARNNLVINNTVLSASDGRWCINISGGSTGNTLRNNILYSAHAFRGVISVDASSRTGFSSDHNSVMDRFSLNGGDTVVTLAAWQAQGYDAHSFRATPADHFVVPGSDFHLLATSPAVDAGVAAGAPSADLDGNPRPVGAGVDLGAYELQLLECGDGGLDPGEECERDGDCGGGSTCQGCRCVVPPPCASGIGFAKSAQSLRVASGRLSFKGEAVLPLPWQGVDPPANGLRLVIDASSGGDGVDLTVPGGAAWRVDAAGTRWTYRDPAGTVGGLTKAVVQDRSVKEPGLVRVTMKGAGGSFTLPDPADVRTVLRVGTAAECALRRWNPPTSARPRCTGDASRLTCR